MIPNIDILEEELREIEYASNTYRIVNVNVYDKIEVPTLVSKGTCGENAIWEFYSSGEFIVKGSGDTKDYDVSNRNREFEHLRNDVKTIIVTDGINRIGNSFFSFFEGSTTALIADSVTSIGTNAFRGCTSLNRVKLPNRITKIDKFTFIFCYSLTNIFIPNAVTEIDESAFRNCTRLNRIEISKNVTTIGNYAFSDCDKLVSIILPNSIKTIGSGCFDGCNNLNDVLILGKISTIASSCFRSCKSLTRIGIPNSVTSIGYIAFKYCDNLEHIYFEGNEDDWSTIDINSTNDLSNCQIVHGVNLNKLVSEYPSNIVLTNLNSESSNALEFDIRLHKNYPNHPNPTCSDYHDRINGYVDDIEAIKQAIYLILSIERYQHIIYSWDYGVELLDLYGKPLPYVMAELPRRITEALTQDDRIEDVTDFEFERNGKRLHTTFTVITNAGNIPTDLEVEI